MTEPYYTDEHVTLWHGNCLEIDAWLEADVLVTDPPYGTARMAANPRGGYGRRDLSPDGKTGFVIENDETTEARDTVLKMWGKRPALVFASPRMPEPPGAWTDRLVWDKKRPGINGGPWRYRHESIYVTSGFVRRNNESMSILTAWPDQSQHIHAKPVPLMTALIDCAPPGVVADPFAGSGSTLVAAAHLGRRSIGVELEERYCEMIATRLAQGCLDFGDAS